MSGMNDLQVKEKALKVKANAHQRRCDDYSVIGGVLGAVSTHSISVSMENVFERPDSRSKY